MMIDFHTHILPGIDDGAKTPSISARMLDKEIEQGVKEVVLTPHYYGKESVAQFLSLRSEAYDALRAQNITQIKFRLGAEVLLTGVNDPDNELLCHLAIEGSRCVLIELPYARWNESLFDKISDFIADTGYSVVIAHAERYEELLKNPALVTLLADMGCYIQLNTSAFVHTHTKKFAFALLKHGLVHCLGTDAHNDEDRAPDYVSAKMAVEKAGYQAEWDEIQWCMTKILHGERLLKAYGTVKKFGKWYF
jgi:protein-tyrosine phosphatase